MAKDEEEEFGGEEVEEELETTVEEAEPSSFVSKEEFGEFKEGIDKNFNDLQNLIIKSMQKPTEAAADAKKIDVQEKSVSEASVDMGEVNPRYEAKAKEVLGEKIERTFVTYPKGGGTLFTIVIKKEFSNAPKDYLERMKEDRRTVNIEREEFRGEDGVGKWATLVRDNLNRASR